MGKLDNLDQIPKVYLDKIRAIAQKDNSLRVTEIDRQDYFLIEKTFDLNTKICVIFIAQNVWQYSFSNTVPNSKGSYISPLEFINSLI